MSCGRPTPSALAGCIAGPITALTVGTTGHNCVNGYCNWDYYRQRFERDRGLKIDFALCSPALADRVTGAFIDRDERDPAQGTGSPSDHAPVVVDLS